MQATPVEKKSYRSIPRMLEVQSIEQVTPLLRRVVLGGEQLLGFPADWPGAHIKVFLPRPGQDDIHMPTLTEKGPVWPPAELRPITRTYSVRYYDPVANELSIDFVMHGHKSHASDWASNAQVGDNLGIAGPGGPQPLIAPADFHLITGDLSAVPAISAILESLRNVAGAVFIEVVDAEQIHELENPANLKINWLVNSDFNRETPLLNAVKQCQIPDSIDFSAWVAGENGAVICVRDYLRSAFGLTKKELYAVPYWRRGDTEEQYHADRHSVMDEEY